VPVAVLDATTPVSAGDLQSGSKKIRSRAERRPFAFARPDPTAVLAGVFLLREAFCAASAGRS